MMRTSTTERAAAARRQESAWQPDEEWIPRGAVRSAEVAAWLREAGVLPLLLGECLHEELLRRAGPLLGALIEHGALETDELDALWDATLNNHASVRAALASVLGAVAPRLPSALVLRLLTLAEELPPKRAEETLLRSLLQICRAQPAAAAERFALTLWRLCAEPAAPAAAMVTLAELLCPPADAGDSVLDSASALRRRFLFVCLRCLHDGSRVLAALRQLRTLLPRLTHTELNAPAAPLSPGPWDSAGASSDESLLEEGESFAAAVLRHSIAEALRFAAAASALPAVAAVAPAAAATSGAVAVDTGPPQGAELVSAVEERLKFVHFVLRGTRLVLSHEDAASLWRALETIPEVGDFLWAWLSELLPAGLDAPWRAFEVLLCPALGGAAASVARVESFGKFYALLARTRAASCAAGTAALWGVVVSSDDPRVVSDASALLSREHASASLRSASWRTAWLGSPPALPTPLLRRSSHTPLPAPSRPPLGWAQRCSAAYWSSTISYPHVPTIPPAPPRISTAPPPSLTPAPPPAPPPGRRPRRPASHARRRRGRSSETLIRRIRRRSRRGW